MWDSYFINSGIMTTGFWRGKKNKQKTSSWCSGLSAVLLCSFYCVLTTGCYNVLVWRSVHQRWVTGVPCFLGKGSQTATQMACKTCQSILVSKQPSALVLRALTLTGSYSLGYLGISATSLAPCPILA